MLVKDLYEVIYDFENLTILSTVPVQEAWQGKAAQLPLRYMNREVKSILCIAVEFNDAGMVITIK